MLKKENVITTKGKNLFEKEIKLKINREKATTITTTSS